jgi:hypothetical protein
MMMAVIAVTVEPLALILVGGLEQILRIGKRHIFRALSLSISSISQNTIKSLSLSLLTEVIRPNKP